MKLRLSIFLALACLLPALPAPPARAQTVAAITKEKVLAAVAALDRATAARKIDAVAAHLADDFRIKAVAEIGGSRHDLDLDRAEYLALGRRSFGNTVAHEYRRQRTEVTISEDGQSAMVTGELIDKITGRDGVVINSISDEVYVFKLRGGKILLTSKYVTIQVL